MPRSWSPADAAGLGATLPVSYGALAIRGSLKAGETVLVHSAAGGLGIMAVQIGVALGCRVIGTAGSEAKCDYARRFGANECFDYTKKDWWKSVFDATDGKGVDVVFDPVGLVDLSLKCIAHRGRILVVGFAGRKSRMERIAMNRVLLKQVNLIGYVSLPVLVNGDINTNLYSDMGKVSAGILKRKVGSGVSSGRSLRMVKSSRLSFRLMRDWRVFPRRWWMCQAARCRGRSSLKLHVTRGMCMI